jgi:hypothetical protein
MKTTSTNSTIESVQKIIKVGDSIAVTIPAKEARVLGFKPGDTVRSRHEQIETPGGVGVDTEYKKFTDQYGDALKNLADR